jgi:hypothetical protein
MRSLSAPKRVVMRSRTWRADLSSPVRRAERNRFSWIVQLSGDSREKRRESGHGSEEVGDVDRIMGAFWARESAVGGGIEDGGVRRFAVDIVNAPAVCVCVRVLD